VLRHVRQHPLGVDEDGVGADRHDDRYAGLEQQAAEIRALADVVANDALVRRFANALRERLHVVTGESAVMREALVDDHELARAFGKRVVVQCKHAADRDEVVLLRGEHGAVGERRDAADQLGELEVPAAGFAILDEQRVLRNARRIEDQRHAVTRREVAYSLEVSERERLAARHVQAGLDTHERHALGRGREDVVERLEVDVALERVERLRIARLADRDVDPRAARELDVRARRREVEVRRDEGAWGHEQLREQMLGAASLVRRDDVAVAEDLLDRALEPEEAARAGI